MARVVSFGLALILCFGYFTDAATVYKHSKSKCGYSSCPKVDSNKLNIHLVAHTHDDVGWLKTVDQYYFGSRTNIQFAGVQYILDSVIAALERDPTRRFIYVETAYFWKWWLQQDEKTRNLVKDLVDNGRLEFIGGAWSMNDEAATHYHSIIDQFAWGLRRLNDTFGECARPRIGWQIDPFGHSREQASIFAQMGYDGLLFARLDYQDKSQREDDKTMEVIWKGSSSLGSAANLFTSVLYNAYSPPPGFCFDVLCPDEPIIDDESSPDYNVDKKVNEFLKFVEKQRDVYRTNNIILTMGGDFTYQYAEINFKNMDKLIRFVNERNGSSVNVFYSTPSCYIKAVNDQQMSWRTKSDDFFPYASDPHSFWTGYFSSRPTLKFYERMGNNYLQVVKQLSVLTDLQKFDDKLELFRQAMGIMQHHDAVTGTEKQQVAQDYARILTDSMQHGDEIASAALNKWQSKPNEPTKLFSSCLLLNTSSCEITSDNKKFGVTVYNPTSQVLSTYIRLPVQGRAYSIKDSKGKDLTVQLVPIPPAVTNIPGRMSSAINELIFRAVDLPPLGYESFTVSESEDFEQNDEPVMPRSIGGDLYNITVDAMGRVDVRYLNNEQLHFTQSFHYYEGAEGDNKAFVNRSSGAYIFRPKGQGTKNIPIRGTFNVIKGPLVEELHQVINEWISQVVRVYKDEPGVEFNWLVGPIPVKDKVGKEVVTRYSSSLKTNGEFYTDSNGREMLKRKKNYRPTWNLKLEEPIAGNYYPVISKMTLQDEKAGLRLSALTDRAQGGSSLIDGEIELMAHRRLLKDDAFGVDEALNETAFGEGLVSRGEHYILGGSFGTKDELVLNEKAWANKLSLRPWIFLTPLQEASYDEWSAKYDLKKSGLASSLPENVKILTLEPWKDGTVLLRLEHLFETGESLKYSVPVDVDLKNVFTDYTILSIDEMTLDGNQRLDEMKRLNWKVETNEVDNAKRKLSKKSIAAKSLRVTLNPMQIRTFVIQLSNH